MSTALRVRDLRVVWVAAAAWVTALVCVFAEHTAWLISLLLWAAVLVLLIVLSRGGRRHGVLGMVVIALAFSAGAASAVGLAAPMRAQAQANDGFAVEVIADITSALRSGRDGRLWFDAQTHSLASPGERAPRSVSVRIGAEVPEDGIPVTWEMGARIRIIGQARATDAGERSALVVFGRGEVVVERSASPVFAVAGEVRRLFVERAVRLPEPGAGLLPGLAVGDTRAVSEELQQSMLTSGLSHLTAVSGANCAIVIGAMYGFVALCRGGRALRVATATLALGAFVILVTPEPSVIRAATMAGIGMLSLLMGRPGAGVGVLSLAVGVILIIDPWLGATPGFALSAASTAALIVLARPVSRGLARWMAEPIAIGVAVPLAAQLACGPILGLFSEQQSVIGVVANMLAAPAAPIATVIGLLACLALPFAPLADLLAASAWLPAAWIATTAQVAAALPGASLRVEPGIGTALVIAVLTAAVIALLVRGREGVPAGRRVRALSATVLAVAAGVGAGGWLVREPLGVLSTPGNWSIVACDVGQGDAVLVRSAGRVALVDTGPDPAALRACLATLGIRHIDLLVITHFDLDHYGGTEAVHGRVGTVLHGPVDDDAGRSALASLRDHGALIHEGYAGIHGALGEASWRVLWPARDARGVAVGNDTSLVLEIGGGLVPRALLLGDLGADAQRRLLTSGRVRGPYTLVKVSHHGSRDQEPSLYAATRAAIALFNVGENNYGHPHADALAMVEGARILRTDTQGRISVALVDGGVGVWTEHSAP